MNLKLYLMILLLLKKSEKIQKVAKKIKRIAKNIFHYSRKWYKIKQITEERDVVRRRRAAREQEGRLREDQKSGTADQDRGGGQPSAD